MLIYQDEECANVIGKVWKDIGIHSRSSSLYDENIGLGFFGATEVSNLIQRKPWRHIFAIAKLKNAFALPRDTIVARLTRFGFISSETWSDSDFTYDYYLEGCDPLGTIKAILGYSRTSLIAYWTEERLKGQVFEIVNGKYLYYSNNKIKNVLKDRVCDECKGGIGSPLIEGCSKECKNRKWNSPP